MVLLIDKITANFTATFNNCVERIVSAIEKKIENRTAFSSSEICELHKKVDSLERQNKSLESINGQLNDRLNQLNSKFDSLSTHLDDLEQYSRGANLLIHRVLHRALRKMISCQGQCSFLMPT
jgi:predicted RNase H-like nuclease (RuvC/YqgF family)